LPDINANVIRKITPSGVVSIFAGTGVNGHTGDGGPATAAEMFPICLAIDAIGNMYLADGSYGHYLRKIDTFGIITTIAGYDTIAGVPYGDGGPASAADIY